MRDTDVIGQREAQSEAGELIVRGAVKCGEYDFLVGLLYGLFVPGEVAGQFFKETVRINVDEQAQEGAKLRRRKHSRGLAENALKGRSTRLAQLLPSFLFGLVLLLLAFPLSFALRFKALLFGFVLLASPLELGSALFGFFFCLLLGCWLHHRGRVLGFLSGKTGRSVWIMNRAVVVGANGDGLSSISSEGDQCGFGIWAGRLGVRVIWDVEFPVGVLGENAGALFFCGSPCGFDLDKIGPRRKFAVDMRCNLGLVAGSVEALCGIWATGKYFLPVGSCRVARVRSGR